MRELGAGIGLVLSIMVAGCGDGPSRMDAGDAATDAGFDAFDPLVTPPLGMRLALDGVTYAGAAVVDITPEVSETFEDLDGNALFDGCLDLPAGGTVECPEPFLDANGNGRFDAVWIAGFSPMRAAQGVNDPIYARALVLSHDGEYVAFVSVDVIALTSVRLHDTRDRLVAEGFDGDRFIAAATHNHQGPDTLGLWGDPLAAVSGMDPAYQARVADAMETAVREAASAMEAVTFRVGATSMRDRSVFFNGSNFGGKNPTARMHGMVHDIRDPVIVSDQLLVMQGVGESGGTVFTFTLWSGHPESWGSSNNLISSDWPGVMRDLLEERYGGVAIHMPESLGGMQSALGGDVPLVDPDGLHRYVPCAVDEVTDPADMGCFGRPVGDPRLDADGDPIPLWAAHSSHEFIVSQGWHMAEAAFDVLDSAETHPLTPIRVMAQDFNVPVTNAAYLLLAPTGIFDIDLRSAIRDPVECPDGDRLGCLPTRAFRIRMGPVELLTAPGEILPEVVWGLPEAHPAWSAERDDPSTRDATATFFVQHDAACDTLMSYEECQDVLRVGECDCLRVHAFPYRISDDPSVPPLLDLSDAPFRAAMSMVDDYFSYVIPYPDMNRQVSLLSDDDGDHFEDTVTISHQFAPRWQDAQLRLHTRFLAAE